MLDRERWEKWKADREDADKKWRDEQHCLDWGCDYSG